MRAPLTYEIRIADQLDEATLQSFAGLDVTVRAAVTVITGLVEITDQDGVRAVGFDPEVAECVPADLTQTAGDDDPIAVRMHVPSAWT